MLRAYKTELNSNNKQRTQFIKCAGTARFIFNWALADRIERYKQGLKTNKFEQKRRFNALKKEQFSWIYDSPYTILGQEFDNCDLAFVNFFRRIKKGEKQVGYPKFKSKKNGIGSFTLRGCINVESNQIKLPRIGWVRLKEDNYLPTKGVKILSANISERAGHWFVSLQVETQQKSIPLKLTDDVIGVDLGIKVLATCSDGKIFDNPKSLAKSEKRLAHAQRELCRRKKGSKNREKTKKKIAKLHYTISNVRRYALNEVSNYLTVKAKPKVIVLENLNVKGMQQNKHLSNAISDASFSELRRQVEYKAKWYGEKVVIADRFYPSSKTCSECGSVKPLLKLSERMFVCEECGAVMNRDYNASLNLASLAV
jgi:putative transposase